MKSLVCFAFLFLLTALLLQSVKSQPKLIFIQELFRHGARYPIYKVDGEKSDFATKGHLLGQLTTGGKNMHYLLGKKIYQQYWNKLFRDTPFENQYNQTKFYFKSTDVNRTFESAQSHLMGIFDSLPKLQILSNQINHAVPLWPGAKATAGDVFPNAPFFHPLPVHAQKLGSAFNDNGDFLRSYSPDNCPKQNVWQAQNKQQKFIKQIQNNPNFTKAFQQLARQAQQPSISFQLAAEYYDNYECQLYLGKPSFPVFTDPKYQRNLDYVYMLDLFINLFYTENQIRTTSSGFFQATLANINRAIQKRDVQWVIYSAHDTTVGNMLAAMNMTNVACIYEAYLKGDDVNSETCVSKYPGFTASIIFEVYQDTQTTLTTFKIRYLGSYRKIPFCGYQQECPLSRLQSWYENSIKVDNFAANCGLFNESKQFYKGFAIIEFGVILSFLIFWVMKHLKRAKHDISKLQSGQNVKQITNGLIQQEIKDP